MNYIIQLLQSGAIGGLIYYSFHLNREIRLLKNKFHSFGEIVFTSNQLINNFQIQLIETLKQFNDMKENMFTQKQVDQMVIKAKKGIKK